MKSLKLKFVSTFAVWVFLSAAQLASAFYDPSLGRWLNRDPLGEPGAALRHWVNSDRDTGYNLYAYVGNRPMGAIDAFGLAYVNSGVKICDDDDIHAWLEFPGGSAGFYPGDSIWHGPGKIVNPDPHANDPKKKCRDFKLDDTCYDLPKFQECVASEGKSGPGPNYCVIGSNCGNWVNDVLGKCSKAAKKPKATKPKK